MEKIYVNIDDTNVGELFFEKDKNQYGFNYLKNYKPISLIMPYKSSSYIWKYKLHPIFDMNMPEGYLFELFKNYLTKEYGYIDDFLVFSHICSNIQSRLTYKSEFEKKEFFSFDLNEVMQNDTQETFYKIVTTFLDKNAISGIQPKSLAILEDKESLVSKEYIIKTWADEYPQLALNEYFCLKAILKTDVKIPNIKVSKNGKFLLVERFNYDKQTDSFFGFEEILCLLGKNKDEKYSGSYEQISKVIYSVSTQKLEDMKSFYKLIIMNYLLKNGDAHLKNFGLLFDDDFKNIFYSPVYDVVNTVVYIHKDKPALMLDGKKIWHSKDTLIKFGQKSCLLSQSEANKYYKECYEALIWAIDELENYLNEYPDFKIGKMMLDSWKLSLKEVSIKELDNDIIRTWKNY